mgnify:CR=1 FL=1
MTIDYTPRRRRLLCGAIRRAAEAGRRGVVPRRLFLGSPVRLWLFEGAAMAAVFAVFWMAAVVL